MNNLLAEIRSCRHCETKLPHGPRPIVQASPESRILIIGQAPGRHVHETGIPWNDPSGVTLRKWLGISKEIFYDSQVVAHIPMGFCYPGKGKQGDLPPRPECAILWHKKLVESFEQIRLRLIVGAYAQRRYTPDFRGVTPTVKRWKELGPKTIPLPHPSPLNRRWLKANPWFEIEVIPELRQRIARALE